MEIQGTWEYRALSFLKGSRNKNVNSGLDSLGKKGYVDNRCSE